MQNLDPIFVDRETACRLLGMKRTKFFAACRDNRLVRAKDGRKVVVTFASVRRYAEQLLDTTPNPVSSRTTPSRSKHRRKLESMSTSSDAPLHLTAPLAPVHAELSPALPEPGCDPADYNDGWLALAAVCSDEPWPISPGCNETRFLTHFKGDGDA